MKVSVLTITFNQEEFIEQTLESILMQETSFPFELVISDDASSDGTPEIIKHWQQRYPTKIRAFLHETNLGCQGKKNFVYALKACQGQYVAVLDGDDYWTSPKKLQRQSDFLDKNPQCSICFHHLKVVNHKGETGETLLSTKTKKQFLSLEDLILENFIPASSAMFRNRLIEPLPDWYFENVVGDWSLHLLNAQHGRIGKIDQHLGVYRKNTKSISHNNGGLKLITAELKTREQIDNLFGAKYKKQNELGKSRALLEQAKHFIRLNENKKARQHLYKFLNSHPTNSGVHPSKILSIFMRSHFPKLFWLLRSPNTN